MLQNVSIFSGNRHFYQLKFHSLFFISDFKLELKSPLTQFVRFVQIFPRKPRPPHFGAQRIALTVKPIFPKQFDKDFPQHLKCRKLLKSLSKRTEVGTWYHCRIG